MITIDMFTQATGNVDLAQVIYREFEKILKTGIFLDMTTIPVDEEDVILGEMSDPEKALYTLAFRYRNEIKAFMRNMPKNHCGLIFLTSLGQVSLRTLEEKKAIVTKILKTRL